MLVAWLMVTRSVSLTEAMGQLRRARPVISPNAGFIRQLRLFEAMGCRVDTDCSRYRYFSVLHNSVRRIEREWTPTQVRVGDIILKCSKCRSAVANQQQFLPHTPGKDPDWCPQEQKEGTTCKDGVFIVDVDRISKHGEPASWDKTQKFNCAKCCQKVGNIGTAQCPCGASSRKLIWINLSKVDRSYKR